ncbi:hypothetical protein Vadar_022563 [Vaccinium darrowii]|uniref:Uncharacterized protein n=1 Tax=Vaccinium darrowii TaxID=229202 RepID=A0ACB7Y9P3_9ERIC|nr:hypothetical protein Vadar_022563 [Vaccinium darrowii]
MTLSGLTSSPAQYCLHLPAKSRGMAGLHLSSTHCDSIEMTGPVLFRDVATNDSAIFPRINIGDPYKRLGISREASEEEIQAARNFLIKRYGGLKPSVNAIESAHDKIIMQKFYERRHPKVDIKKKVRAVPQSRIVQAVTSRFTTPSTSFIIKTFAAFAILGALSVLFPTGDGPTVQVAVSLMATIYFIHDRLKSKWRALFYGVGAFFVLMAVRNLLDGVCDSFYTERTKEFGSYYFIDNLHASLAFLYLFRIVP